jgi:hypothetical protein
MAAMSLLAILSIQAVDAKACTRREKFKRSFSDPIGLYHGPGTYGKLDRTVTLNCLSYVGSIERDGEEHVLIQDEKGEVHVLTVGSWMGWYRSVIVKIDADYIHLRQLVNFVPISAQLRPDPETASEEEIKRYNEHTFKEVTVKFPKRPRER